MRSKIPFLAKEGQIAYKHDVGRFLGVSEESLGRDETPLQTSDEFS